MRVLHYSKYYPPVFGGLEKVVYDLVEGLNIQGVSTDVLCMHKQLTGSKETAGKYSVIRSGCLGVVASTPLSVSQFWHFVGMMRQYDVIHLHLPNPLANLVLLLSGFRGKVVLHWHSDIVKQKNILRLYRPLQNWLLKRADKIITTSENYAASSGCLKDHRSKIEVVPIGVDVSELAPDEQLVNQIRERYSNRKIVFCLGRMIYYKGFEYIVKAAEQLSDDVVVVIGGKGEEEERLRQLIVDAKLVDKVHLVGGIPHDQLGSYYQAAHLFCLPSVERSEAFGVVQVEAMSFSKPVVSTRIQGSGVDWVNCHQQSGLTVPVKDPDALAQAINSLVEDADAYTRLAEGAKERFQSLFTVDEMVSSVADLYRRI